MLRLHTTLFLSLMLGCSTAIIEEPAPSSTVEGDLSAPFADTGGSVLAFLRVGAYATEPTQANWDRDVRGAVTHHHLDPQRLRQHLRALKEAGQRRVAIVLWFTEPIDGQDTWMHAVVPRADGTLPPQAQANLLALLGDIDAVGFDEVQIRFGPQGGAEWRCFKNPACYADPSLRHNPHLEEAIAYSWDVIRTAIDLVEAQGFRTPRLYDVVAEYAGHPFMAEVPGWNRYASRLWELSYARYTPRGVAVNMSFNHAQVSGTEAAFDLFDRVGWPEKVSIDVYENIYGAFGVLADALARRGRQGFPVFVQETFVNDASTADELKQAATDFGVNLRFVMQWPVTRPLVSHASTEDLSPYGHYLGLRSRPVRVPRPDLGSLSASPDTCRIARGAGTCSVQLRWTTRGARDVRVLFDGRLVAAAPTGTADIPWVTQTALRFDLVADGTYVGSAVVRGLPEGLTSAPPPPPNPASGTLRATPETCALSAQGLCTSTLEWTTVNVRDAEVRVGAQRFASGTTGRQDAPWIQETPVTFELFGDGRRLASVTVRGVRPPPLATPGPIRASPERCSVGAAGLCSTTISWSAAEPATVFVDGKPFAAGVQGQQQAPWIQVRPYLFRLVADADGRELGRVVVEGAP